LLPDKVGLLSKPFGTRRVGAVADATGPVGLEVASTGPALLVPVTVTATEVGHEQVELRD
jgi:hypothetical protein